MKDLPSAIRWGTIFLLLVAPWSCSLRLTDPARYPAAVVRLDVSPYAQEPEQCGPYALAAVLSHLGRETSAEELSQRLYTAGARGSLTMDLFLEASRRGLPVRQTEGSFESVARDLDSRRPSILLIRHAAMGIDRGHFIVVSGYSRRPDGFFLLWGDGGVSWMSAVKIVPMWRRSGFWTLSFAESVTQ